MNAESMINDSSSSSDALFTPLEMSMSLSSIIAVSAHQLIIPCPGVSFTPYHAGHVLGACMFLIDIAGLKILYTGDYSREEDRHLVKAEVPPVRPDVLIVESTYGVQSLEGRDEKELRFTSLVHSIVRRGGHVLLPSFALGRAQELLLILDEYWKKHPDLHNVPIYYASNLARKCMAVYQTYIHTMNSNIRSRFAKRDNPFVFKCVVHNALRGYSDRPCLGISPIFLSHAVGNAKSQMARHVSCWQVQVFFKLGQVVNCLSSGHPTLEMGSLSPDTLSREHWLG
jgi:cleavage and polyadenylation specificity factor subunit 3